jgi:hypothetical protein
MNKVSFGPASWIGLIGAIAAALSPLVTNLPGTYGAIIGACLAGVVVIGRQLQAALGQPVTIDATGLVADAPAVPTDVPAPDISQAG